jgi:hypothetical protein
VAARRRREVADSIEEARRRYAEELRFTAKVGSCAVIEAFAIVPRERFFGPGPWRVLSPMAAAEYWMRIPGEVARESGVISPAIPI